jgi:hypothetical protein
MTRQTAEGFLVAHVRREHGHFSVTGDLYTSRRAYDLGSESAIIACGCLHAEILRAFPELAQIVALHLSDVTTGEPMHAESNASYFYLGAYSLGSWRDDYGYAQRAGLSASDYARKLAAAALRIEPDDFPAELHALAVKIGTYAPDTMAREDAEQTFRDAFSVFVDAQRERWQNEARDANAWIDAHATPDVSDPADVASGETYAQTFDAGLSVRAKLTGETADSIGGHYQYRVTVSTVGQHYRGTFTGSAADYDDGRIDARQAALGVLSDLCLYRDRDADDLAADYGLTQSPHDRGVLQAMRRQCRAYERMSDAIDANAHLFGQ